MNRVVFLFVYRANNSQTNGSKRCEKQSNFVAALATRGDGLEETIHQNAVEKNQVGTSNKTEAEKILLWSLHTI